MTTGDRRTLVFVVYFTLVFMVSIVIMQLAGSRAMLLFGPVWVILWWVINWFLYQRADHKND